MITVLSFVGYLSHVEKKGNKLLIYQRVDKLVSILDIFSLMVALKKWTIKRNSKTKSMH